MCKVCDRVESVIAAMESLYTLEDWKALLLDVDMAEGDPEMNDIILTDDANVWMNVIALIAATWCYKKKIPMFPAIGTVTQHIGFTYMHHGPHPTEPPDSES
jgi:hypothetical protein